MQCPLCGQDDQKFERDIFDYDTNQVIDALWFRHMLEHHWSFTEWTTLYDDVLGFAKPANVDYAAIIAHPQFTEGIVQVEALRLLQKVRS
jgi:hypothetical protein